MSRNGIGQQAETAEAVHMPERGAELMYLPNINVVGDVVKKSGTKLDPRRLTDYELLYFPDSTRCIYTVDGRTYTLSEPCFVITRPGEMHSYTYDPIQPSRHLFIHFDIAERNALLPILQKGSPSYFPVEGELLFSMMKQILYIAYAFPDRLQQRGGAMLAALLEEINGGYMDHSSVEMQRGIPPQIARAMEYIDEHLSEPITVEGLAKRVGWTHEHFSRSFVRYMRHTPREMIIQRRIERACQLLLYEDLSIRDVAYSVGFTDENYFSRVFKTVKGLTATAFRKKYFNQRYIDLYPVKKGDSLYPMNWIFVPQ